MELGVGEASCTNFSKVSSLFSIAANLVTLLTPLAGDARLGDGEARRRVRLRSRRGGDTSTAKAV